MEKVNIENNSPPKGLDIYLFFDNDTKKACYRCTCPDNDCICYRDIVTNERIKTINPIGWERII